MLTLINSRRRCVQICITIFEHSACRMQDSPHKNEICLQDPTTLFNSTASFHGSGVYFGDPFKMILLCLPCELERDGFNSNCIVFLYFRNKQAKTNGTPPPPKARAALNDFGYNVLLLCGMHVSGEMSYKCHYLSRKQKTRITSRCSFTGQNMGSVIGGD